MHRVDADRFVTAVESVTPYLRTYRTALWGFIQDPVSISSKSMPGLTFTTANELVMDPSALSLAGSSSSYVSAKDEFEQDSASSANLEAHDAVLTTPGLLAQVFSHLGCIKAIALCSTINKCWQAASQQVQLRSIVLRPANGLTLAEAECILVVCKTLKAQVKGIFSQLRHNRHLYQKEPS